MFHDLFVSVSCPETLYYIGRCETKIHSHIQKTKKSETDLDALLKLVLNELIVPPLRSGSMPPPPKKKQKPSTISNLWASSPTSSSSELNLRSIVTPSTPMSETPAVSKKRASFIWDYGIEFVDSNGNKCWKCSVCPATMPKILPVSSTSNQRYHLKSVHHITDSAEEEGQQTLDTHLLKPFQVEIMRKLLVEWIIERRHAFREVESPGLRRIFQYLDPRSTKALTTRNTVRDDCMRYFNVAKSSVIQALSRAQSRIHLEFDLWTSPNYKAMIAITAHWTDDEYKVQSTLIAI